MAGAHTMTLRWHHVAVRTLGEERIGRQEKMTARAWMFALALGVLEGLRSRVVSRREYRACETGRRGWAPGLRGHVT